MSIIKARFNHQFSKIDALLSRAQLKPNPGLWLYLNDLRTPVFMLEGLSRIYRDIHKDDKIFEKIYDVAKELEDVLGAVDHYVTLYKNCADNVNIDEHVKDFFYNQAQVNIEYLNDVLEYDGWMKGKKLNKFHKKLRDIEEIPQEEENMAIIAFYNDEIEEIKEFVTDQNFNFDDMESDVHELRRKVRWLSIYPQALNGVIQLSGTKAVPAAFKKYLTPEILNSPYNVLPVNKDKLMTINFDKNSFFAVSWLINELGYMKDKGLMMSAIKEALQETHFMKDADAEKLALKAMGAKQISEQKLLTKANEITKLFVSEGILDKLIKN
jgi:hypothetical protein